jgi:hypothetical protein
MSEKLALARDLRELLEAALSVRTPVVDRRNAISMLTESLKALDEELAEEEP